MQAKLSRWNALRVAGPLLLTLVNACESAEGPESVSSTSHSVILVVIDTLRADHLSVYGYSKPTSPALEALAQESVLYERCLAASSWTQPSTASLLTGLLPRRHGVHENARLADEVLCFAEVLQEAGYATAGFSGNPNASPIFGFDQGFDHFFFSQNRQAKEYPDIRELLEQAETWLADHSTSPYFLYLHVMNVHGPYRSPAGFADRFREQPSEEFEFQSPLWRKIMREGDLAARDQVKEDHLRDLRARYDASIAYTDQELGAFVERLRDQGSLQNSFVVITSDHGEELFDHGGFGHGWTVYDEVLHVPLLLRPPDQLELKVPQRLNPPVSLVDLPATLLDAVGLLDPSSARVFGDGLSLWQPLQGTAHATPRPRLAEVQRGKQGSSWAYEEWPYRVLSIERDYRGKQSVVELYRLDLDPEEDRDLATTEPDRLLQLRQAAEEWQADLQRRGYDSTPQEIDAALQQMLDALGYAAE
jgi:arylsulfatase